MTKSKRKSKPSQQKTKAKVIKIVSPLSASQLKTFKKELIQLQQSLSHEIEKIRSKDLQATMETGPGDDADVATQTYEKEMLFEISGSERETLMKIEEALYRITNKTYGRCDQCKKPIPLKRLRILPYSRYCLACQNLFESKQQ